MKRFEILPWLGILMLLAACGDSGRTDSTAAGGGHHHASAHGGTAVELGRHEFHLDVVLDPAAGWLRAWVMTAHMDSFVRVPAKSIDITAKLPSGDKVLSLEPVANQATGEKTGDTSLFETQSDSLKGVTDFDAVLLQLSVRDKTYTNIAFRVGSPSVGATKP